jgi:quercetin dioxygenase-like cupin family protein
LLKLARNDQIILIAISHAVPSQSDLAIRGFKTEEAQMGAVRHERAAELENRSLDEIIERYTQEFKDIEPDWNAFADSQLEGGRRAQHRFIGAGGSGKHNDPSTIPAGNFTLSVMFLPPGQGSAAHTHEVEEVFFVLKGVVTVFLEDGKGHRISKRLGQWGCISCPAGVLHGFVNEGVEGAYMQTLIGAGRPGPVGFADDDIYEEEKSRLAASA